jgi:membrane protein
MGYRGRRSHGARGCDTTTAVFVGTLQETFRCFTSHGGRVLGAATAFYGVISLAPTLLIAVVVTGTVTDREDARRQVVQDLSLWLGQSGAETIGGVLDHLAESGSGPVAGIVSGAVLLWASARLFWQLRYSLNHLWGVREVIRPDRLSRNALRHARRRLSALVMVAVVSLVVALTVLGKAVLGAAARHLNADLGTRWHVLEFAASFGVLTMLCVAVFKVLPAVRIGWRDASIGAVVTAALFSLGATALGWYLGVEGTSSTYGAAGSLVALLMWVYYSAQAFFLGAAFTRVWAERHGEGLELVDGAVRIVEDEGLPPIDAGGSGSG